MDGLDGSRRWRSLKRRLRSKLMGCCGAPWASTLSNIINDPTEGEEETAPLGEAPPAVADDCPPGSQAVDEACSGRDPAAAPPMSLATALAAERNSRAARGHVGPTGNSSRPFAGPTIRTLMRLTEEIDGQYEPRKGSDWMCCVCMERNKGAAFIPCGHTFCRICSRDLWLSRGSCPICSRRIIQVLDIF